MAWRPLHKNHAIERVRVICAFNADLRPKFTQRLAEFIEPKRAHFQLGPMRELKGQGLILQLGPNGPMPSKTENIAGWSFQRTLPDNRVVESLSLENSALTYEVSNYTRWKPFHERVVALMEEVVNEILTYDDMAAFALEYIDRFIFEGDPKDADPRDIFELDEKMIPTAALDEGNLWHVHKGWFEPSPNGSLLVNQNLDAQDGEVDNVPARSISILTKIEGRTGNVDLSPKSLTTLLPEMHTRSKDVLKDILKPHTIKMIGMSE